MIYHNDGIYTINENIPNIKLDMIGQSLQVGDTILCKGYASAMIDTQAEIVSINRKTISVLLLVQHWELGNYVPQPENHVGLWNSFPDQKSTTTYKRRTKRPDEVIKVSPELLQAGRDNVQQIKDDHPELFI